MKEAFEQELAEYKSFSEEIKDTLETNYQMAMINSELEDAYNAVGDLMAFKLIDVSDPRIQKNNSMYVAGGVDKNHRFRLDYRRDTGFIPEWIYGKINPNHKVQVDSIEHWGKRVEGNYSGDTVFKSHPVTFRISQCSTPKQVENAIDSIEKLFKKLGKATKLTDTATMVKLGVYRLFNMEFDGPCLNQYKYIGAILVKMGSDGIECSLILNYDAIKNNWIKIEDTITAIEDTFDKMANQQCIYKVVINNKKAIESQNTLIANKGDTSIKPK